MLRPAHGGRRVEGQDAAGGEPIEHHPDGGEVLFRGRGGMPVAEVLDISRDMDQAHGGNRGHAVRFEPGAELADSPHAVSAGYLWFWQSALRGASFLVRAVPRASVVA